MQRTPGTSPTLTLVPGVDTDWEGRKLHIRRRRRGCVSKGFRVDSLATGQCLCGAVTFRISGEFESFFLCHCTRCRRDSGSAHSANLFSSTAKITWLSGEANIRTFRLSGSRHVKCFCTICGSALPFSQPDDGVLVVPAGSLDGALGRRPDAHICFSVRADWDDDLASLSRFDEFPA
ncbi:MULTISPECIES: GFA family protein [Rhodovulum]|uniref:GFA family protein n=1 Tax=Rhodovulum visakhapatnamense TaxID=364297 RepID=A0ABS1RK91_9RHOB|nr:GFA family protein [Rhodovulum visakhapatnamense]MBL3579312.1 GFA family protein [Rhodovulum visakhapatnamense]